MVSLDDVLALLLLMNVCRGRRLQHHPLLMLAVGLCLVILLVSACGSPPTPPSTKFAGPRSTSSVATAPGGLAAETSAIGSFTNSVPIQIPSFHGIEPHVSLDYDSAAGNGEVGVGWRLTVGSLIVRSGPNGGLPRYDDSDVFRVDGTELVACAPTCKTGGTHETRQQSFERFVFDGTTWTRWRRDGVKLVYEAPNQDQSAYRWALARVVDTHTNTVTYSQDCPNHCFFNRITYGASTAPCGANGQPACKAGADIRFLYEIRPDIVTYPTGKGTVQIRQRLRTVAVSMDGHLVAAYALQYATNPSTGNSLLRSVQQFPSDAKVATDGTVTVGPTPPLPPVTFSTASMSAPQPQWTTRPISGSFAITSPPGEKYFPRVETSISGNLAHFTVDGDPLAPRSPLYGDFDGDGRVDVASGERSAPCHLSVRLALNPQAVKTTAGVCTGNAYVTDLNGDGVDDLLLSDHRRALSNRDGTFTIEGKPTGGPWGNATVIGPTVLRCAVGDFNGDDLGDLACVYQKPGAMPRLGTMRSTPDGGWIQSDIPLPPAITSVSGEVLLTTGDADASTTTDIMLAVANKNTNWSLVTGYTAPDGSIASWVTTPTTWNRGMYDLDILDLSSGDLDRDARADYILVAHSSGSLVWVATSEKGSQPRPATGPINTPARTVAVGDSDGDGADDLLTGDPVGVLRSNGDGTFAGYQSFTTSSATSKSCSNPDPEFAPVASAADVNGDGQADLLCETFVLREGAGGRDHFDLWAQPSPVAPPAPHRWTVFDQNGDGRQDLYAVHYRNPGYEVYTLIAQQGGGYVMSHTPVLPDPTQADGPALANPDAPRWMPIDVGSPQGVPDGKTDLVFVDREGTRLRVTTLLSTGSGWTVKSVTPWRDKNGVEVPYGATDVQAWRPAELNGDDKVDLVHFFPLGTGVRVEYLLSNGDGTWTSGGSDHFQSAAVSGGPLTRQDVGTFRVGDLNRDGLSDFTHIEVGGGPSSSYYTIRSLISTGPTSWREETWQRFQPIDTAAAHRLQFMDFDGDGVGDLGRAVVLAGCIRVEAYLHGLDGWSAPVSVGSSIPGNPPKCPAANALEDRRNLILTDVNGDGRTDVRQLSRIVSGTNATNTMYTLLNPGDPVKSQWGLLPPTSLTISDPDSWAWIPLDTDHNGVPELAHFNPSQFETLRWNGADDRITAIDNGRGAKTTITYRAQPEARAYLPTGMLPIVVDRITVSDATYSPPVQATATFTYEGASWSTRYRQMVGYSTIRSEQGQTTVVTGNDLTDACGVRRSSTTTEATSKGEIAKVSTDFYPPGSTPPFNCLPHTMKQVECELTTQCLEKLTTYGYDSYGNVVTVDESGGSLHRQTNTPVHANTTDYIVDRPYMKEVRVPDPSDPQAKKWLTKAKTLFGYDDDTWEHAPHQHGDLTRITAFSDLEKDTASETFQQFDGRGNLIWTENPVGVVTTTTYDTDRELFPVSTCTPIGCTTTVWDETLGVVRSVKNPNQQTTTTDPDAFGRPTTTTRPDGSKTTIRYLQTGNFTGPDSQRQRIRTEISDGSPDGGFHWHEDLIDGLGRTYRTLDEGVTPVANDVLMTEIRYADASDRRAASSFPYTIGQPLHWTSYCYDAAHRLIKTIHPGGGTGEITLDTMCEATAQNPTGEISRAYHVGTVEDRDELGHVTTSRLDAFGRTIQVDEHVRPCDTCDPKTQNTHYTYDALDNVLTITDAAAHTTTIVRDSLDRETSITDSDRGTRTRTWRADGTLEEEHDAKGVHIWTYDTAGRPRTRTDTGTTGIQTAQWDYDRDPTTNQTQGYSIGHTTLITYATSGAVGAVKGTDRFWYDQLGRPVLVRNCVDTVCQDMGYTYDAAGRIQYLRYPKPGDPDGEQVKYSYDPAGHLTSVGNYLTDIHYDATGQPTQQTYGNGLIEKFTYDPDRLWLDTQTLDKTQKPVHHNPLTPNPFPPLPPLVLPLYAATYTHDLTARIRTLTTANASVPFPQPVLETFTYDELGRLATHSSSDHPALLPEKYEYDAIGRITQSPTAGTYHYDDPTHLHAVTSTNVGHQRVYDAAGNLKNLTDPNGRSLKITWTPQGMPQTIANGQGATTMAYRAEGERVKRISIGTGATTYFFGRYVEQSSAGLTKYYWAGDTLIARRNPNGSVSYLLQDHVHSTRVVTDQNQAVTGRYNYDPYGKQKTDNQTDGTNHLWQGQRADDESGLVYMNARYYDPELSQFTAADSIIPNPYQPQTLNRYAFNNGDGGINTEDPTGHMSMRVELKKEQELQGLRTVAMEAHSLQMLCIAGVMSCPEALAPKMPVRVEVCLSCSKPSEWKQYPGESLSAPPLITGEDAPLTAPPLITGEDAPLTAPPLITGGDAPLTAPPLVAARPVAAAAPKSLNDRGTVASLPRSASLMNAFGWLSYSSHLLSHEAPLNLEVEFIGIAGIDSNGELYTGSVAAVGGVINFGGAYVSIYHGSESLAGGEESRWRALEVGFNIDSYGGLLGLYQTSDPGRITEIGMYGGLREGPLAAGFGFGLSVPNMGAFLKSLGEYWGDFIGLGGSSKYMFYGGP
jgi:RHS repeat-associated protein